MKIMSNYPTSIMQTYSNTCEAVLFCVRRLLLGRRCTMLFGGTHLRVGNAATRLAYHMAVTACTFNHSLMVCGDYLIHESLYQGMQWWSQSHHMRKGGKTAILGVSSEGTNDVCSARSLLCKKSLFKPSVALYGNIGKFFITYGTQSLIFLPGSFDQFCALYKQGIFDGVLRRNTGTFIFIDVSYWQPCIHALPLHHHTYAHVILVNTVDEALRHITTPR